MRYWVNVVVLASSLFVVSGSPALGMQQGRPNPPTSYRILLAGDSITWGAGSPGGYRIVLEQHLRATGSSFAFVGKQLENSTGMGHPRHEGHGGWSTTDLTYGRASEPTQGRMSSWLRYAHPDTVVIMIGTNDNIWVSKEEWTAKYEKLLDQVFAYNPRTRVVMASIPKSDTTVSGKAWAEAVCFDIVRSVVASRKARGFNIGFADTYTTFDPSRDLWDTYHPNKNGYQKIGDAIYNTLRQLN